MAPNSFEVPVKTQPPGAAVWYEGSEVGATPCSVTMRRTSYEFELRLSGYQHQRVNVGAVAAPWGACNVLTLGLGELVDIALSTDEIPDTDPIFVYLGAQGDRLRTTWTRPRQAPLTDVAETTGLGVMFACLAGAVAR